MSTWWVDAGLVLGSTNPTNEELERLRAEGFNILVSFLDENQQPLRYDAKRTQELGYVRHSIPIRDFQAPTIVQLLEFTQLVESLPPDCKMLIHCEGGTGRTGTMAAAYWIAKGITADAAIERIRKARPDAVETSDQEAVLREFATQIHNPRRDTNSA